MSRAGAKIKLNWMPYAIIIVGFHILGITLLLYNLGDFPQLIGFAFLAYTLGLRHAFDADHIAAIDNTVRKMVEQKEDPTGVGFFFSLGHSSVVFIMSIVTAFSMHWAQTNIPQLKEIGGIIGTAVSGSFLVLIGVINLFIWIDIYRLFVKMRQGDLDEGKLEELLNNRGFLSRFFGPIFKLINKSWHIYPLGFLFGLGFDTASEVALLAISANAATQSVPISAILCLPILFAAGMTLLDTIDGIFMISAYNWAFSTPLRKIYYNLSVTGISVIAALFIGVLELVQILSLKLDLNSGFWGWIQGFDFGDMGYMLVVLFILAWGFSYFFWKFMRLESAPN